MARTTSASAQKWAKKIEAARSAADDRRLDLGHAASLLEMLGDHVANQLLCLDDLGRQELGSRIEYMARVFSRHTEDLGKELEKIELAVMAMGRGDEAEAAPSHAGNVVRLQPDGDEA